MDMISLYYVDVARCLQCASASEVVIEVVAQSFPHVGKFRNVIDPIYNQTMNVDINNVTGRLHLVGSIGEIVQGLYYLQYLPTCITDQSNRININVTYCAIQQLDDGTISKSNHTEIYRLSLNVNSGEKTTYRGRVVEEIVNNAKGLPPYFQTIGNTSNVQMSATLPFYPGCTP
jgi:hypothetical protein